MNKLTDEEYILLAYDTAQASLDPSTQNGAIIAVNVSPYTDRHFRECNRFVDGVEVLDERLADRDTKLHFTEHAERNTIYAAGKFGVSLKNQTMHCVWAACHDCARAIIQTGIRRLVTHKEVMDRTPERWMPSINAANQMFKEAGVKLDFVTGKLGAKPIRLNGQIWNG